MPWGWFLFAAIVAAIVYVMQPRPPKTKRPTLEDFSIPRANQGDSIPMVFGTVRITGPTVVWYGDLVVETETEDGVRTRRFYMGLHFILCHGPIDRFYEITAGDRIAWQGNVTESGTITIDAGDLFGGKRQSGGISGQADILFGESTQTANAYLTASQGTPQPAYRGVVSVVANQCYVSANATHIEPWAFRVTRVLEGWLGGSAWNSTKAEIPLYTVYSYDEYMAQLDWPYWWGADSGFTTDGSTEASLGESALVLERQMAANTFSADDAVTLNTEDNGSTYIASTPSSRILRTAYTVEDGDTVTVGVWIYHETGTPDFHICSIGNAEAYFGNYHGFWLYVYADGRIYAQFGDGAGAGSSNRYSFTSSAGDYPFGEKAFIVVTLTANASDYTSGQFASDYSLYHGLWSQALLDSFTVWVNGVEIVFTYTSGDCQSVAWSSSSYITFGSGYYGASDGLEAALIDSPCVKSGTLDVGDIQELYTRGITASSGYMGMNPAHIVYQAITDPQGMGLPTSMIDTDSFEDAADTFHTEGLGLCLQWTQQESMEDFIQHVCDHAAAVLRVSPRTGKFQLKPLRYDYTPAALQVLDEAQIARVELFERAGYGELIGEVTITYRDIATAKESAVTMQNLAVIQSQSGVVSESIPFPGIATATLAQRVCMRELQARSVPLARCKIMVNREAWELQPGDVFKLSWSKLGLSEVIMRVSGIDLGTLSDGLIGLEAVEDVFGLPASTYAAEQGSGWSDPDILDPDADGEFVRNEESGTQRRQQNNVLRLTG